MRPAKTNKIKIKPKKLGAGILYNPNGFEKQIGRYSKFTHAVAVYVAHQKAGEVKPPFLVSFLKCEEQIVCTPEGLQEQIEKWLCSD